MEKTNGFWVDYLYNEAIVSLCMDEHVDDFIASKVVVPFVTKCPLCLLNKNVVRHTQNAWQGPVKTLHSSPASEMNFFDQ